MFEQGGAAGTSEQEIAIGTRMGKPAFDARQLHGPGMFWLGNENWNGKN